MVKDFRGRLGAVLLLVFLTGCGPSGKLGSVNAVPPPVSVSLSGTSFDFGQNLVGNTLVQTAVTVTNTGSAPLVLNPSLTGDASYSIVAAQSCGAQLLAGASCDVVVSYAPTAAAAMQTATINLNYGNLTGGAPSTVALTGTAAAMSAGTVTPTPDPQVALYTITPPFAGNVTVSFGPTTAYGLNTWSQATPSGGGPVSIEVAGMLANTTYHLRASIQFANGISTNDTDHTFATGALRGNLQSQISAATSTGQTPQGGIEMLNVNGFGTPIVATDLSGNIIWMYNPPDPLTGGAGWFAPKQLSNGDYIALAAPASQNVVSAPVPAGAPNIVREFDLAGNTIKQITMDQLNTKLAAANYDLTLLVFHHDVTVLPNGHWLVLANTHKSVVLNGQTTPTEVTGDVIVDLDTNLNPVWVWNEFDHLDVNRQGAGFPDWTHTNAIVYSKDDGDILVSIRHQSWVVKVDYSNGAGTGDILWRLGYQGDFQLINNGVDDNNSQDWFYGQHGPSFTTSNTSGTFGLTLMDNGDFRAFPPYTTTPVFQIDEAAKTATFEFHQILPPSLYSFWGGNAEMLANDDIEYDLCALSSKPNSQIIEVTNQATPQTVWKLTLNNANAYRGYRLPSLYPGVQW